MKKKIQKLIYVIVLAIVSFVLTELGILVPAESSPAELAKSGDTVSVMSVGQANSILISSGGKYCLIDAGYTEEGHTDPVSYLKEVGVTEIEMLVITHFHADHTSNILDVMDNFKVKKILIPNLTKENTPTSSFFTKLLDRVEERNIKLIAAQKGKSYTIGNGKLKVLDDTYNDLGVNDTSIATLFTQGDFTYLNTADGEKKYEKRLVEVFNKEVTLFVAGHHGSSTSNTKELMTVINPKYIAISAGKDNEYGHPHKEVIELFQQENFTYNITFEQDTLVYSITDGTLLTQ